MALSTRSLAFQLISTTRRGFSPQPLPFVCKRCLAVLAEDTDLGLQTDSISPGSETISNNNNQPSKSKTSSNSLNPREHASKKHARLASKARKKARQAFQKENSDDVSQQNTRNSRTSCTTSKSLPPEAPKCEDSTLGASGTVTEMLSLKEVASACATEVVRKLRDLDVKSAKKTSKARRRRSKALVAKALMAEPSNSTSDEGTTEKSPNEGSLRLTTPDGSINASGTDFSAISTEQMGVPRLAYGLDRVLFNPGVYYLKDPRSRIYNYDPYLEKIMPVSEFDFSLLKDYITSSKDETLTSIAKKQNLKYMSSSSSMTGLLSHFHFLLSNWRPINVSMLSKNFPVSSTKFTKWCKTPSAVYLRYKDGSYAIDNDNTFQTSNVLSYLGRSMEKLLTLSPENYERYRKTNENPVTDREREKSEMYNYSSLGDILMRSQLDAYDPRLPGSGLFDLKSRAVISIRMEVHNHERGLGYEIKHEQGQWESFEREYHDMIRATLLKYALQVRMGRMDGIFVAYHNVERIFGFQYISLDEMDLALHGESNTSLGNQEFELSLKLVNEILNRIVKKFPEQSCKLLFEANESSSSLDIFAKPIDDAEIQTSIKKAGDKIDEVERILRDSAESSSANAEDIFEDNITQDAREVTENPDTLEQNDSGHEADLSGKLIGTSSKDNIINAEHALIADEAELLSGTANENTNTDGEKGCESGLEDISQSLEENEESKRLLDDKLSENGKNATNESSKAKADKPPYKGDVVETNQNPLLLRLHIANKVNGKYVARPERLGSNDRWDVEYRVDEVKDGSWALKLYRDCLDRKRKLFEQTRNEEKKDSSTYFDTIRRLSDQGKHWRQGQDAVDKTVGQIVYEPYLPTNSGL